MSQRYTPEIPPSILTFQESEEIESPYSGGSSSSSLNSEPSLSRSNSFGPLTNAGILNFFSLFTHIPRSLLASPPSLLSPRLLLRHHQIRFPHSHLHGTPRYLRLPLPRSSKRARLGSRIESRCDSHIHQERAHSQTEAIS
jgi:hypothetical protein